MNRRDVFAVLGGSGVLTIPGVASAADGDRPPAPKQAAPDWSQFPRLTGKVNQMLGHSFGYISPQAGEPFHLDLRDIPRLTRLDFDPVKRSYIPLAGPVTVENIQYFSNDAFRHMRLTSKSQSGHVVMIDIVPLPGRKPKYVRVWVVIQSREVMRGVALIDTEYQGAFPARTR